MKAPRRPRRYSVDLTAAQGRLLDTLAHEFRADPGDMIAALAVGSVACLDIGSPEAVDQIHSYLLEAVVEGRCPILALRQFSCTSIGWAKVETAAKENA